MVAKTNTNGTRSLASQKLEVVKLPIAPTSSTPSSTPAQHDPRRFIDGLVPEPVQAPCTSSGQRKTRRREPAGRPSIAGSYLDLVAALDPVVRPGAYLTD